MRPSAKLSIAFPLIRGFARFTRAICRLAEATAARRIAKAERLRTKTRELLDRVNEVEAMMKEEETAWAA